MYHTSLSTKFKDLSISIVDSSNIRAFYSNNGGLHLDNTDLGRLAVNLKLKICKLWCEPEPLNDNYDKEMLHENASNLWSQKNLTHEFSTSDKVATERKDEKSSLGSLKIRNVN